MDIRNEIIKNVMEKLKNRVEQEILDAVQDVLTIELNQYELQERCTELTIQEDAPERALKKYIATKRIEGIAESTIKRYADQNAKLLDFLKKPLNEITAYDIRFYLSYRRETGKVSNRTLDGMRRCYSGFFGWLSAEGMIGRNPCAAVSQIKSRRTD